MGNITTTEQYGNTGTIGIFNQGGHSCGNLIGISTGNIYFSSAAGSGSTLANATAKKLRIFYHKDKMKLDDLLTKEDSQTTKRIFRPQFEINSINLLPKQHLLAPSVEEGYASVLVADPEDAEVYVETIALNFSVPDGACCIVTTKNEIKFRKSDGGVWIDEDGHDHST